jgi:hypothetical protein
MRTARTNAPQTGASAVEFALVLPLFLLVVFAAMELARALYMLNILHEVTRRAASSAAVADFSNGAAMDAIRRSAVFDEATGRLPLGAPITDAHVRIDYLSIARDASGLMNYAPIPAADMPVSPARNKFNCIENPYGSNCIRLVRARICDPGNAGGCDPVPYQPLFPLLNFSFALSRSATIAPAEKSGFVAGDMP